MPPNERGALLHRLADEVERRIPIIGQIEALDAGKLEPHAQGDVANFVATIRYFAEMAQHISRRNVLAVKGHEAWTMRQPWGPCGYIFPWNFPFLLIGWGIAPALAAGNTVVIKPAEDTPLSAIYLSRLAKEVGIPDGVINVVTGLGANDRRRALRPPRPPSHELHRLARSRPHGRRSLRQKLDPGETRTRWQRRRRRLRRRRHSRHRHQARRRDHVPLRPGLLRRHSLARPQKHLPEVRRRVRRSK